MRRQLNFSSGYVSQASRRQPDRAFPAAHRDLGRHSPADAWCDGHPDMCPRRPGVSRIRRSRQHAATSAGIHRLMHGAMVIRTSRDRRPGVSRIGHSRQHAATSAGIHRLKPGLQDGPGRYAIG